MLKNAADSHFLQTDGCTSLLFMWPINIFSSGISTIPQPRDDTKSCAGSDDFFVNIAADMWSCGEIIAGRRIFFWGVTQ